jgi:hypothetical protein
MTYIKDFLIFLNKYTGKRRFKNSPTPMKTAQYTTQKRHINGEKGYTPLETKRYKIRIRKKKHTNSLGTGIRRPVGNLSEIMIFGER